MYGHKLHREQCKNDNSCGGGAVTPVQCKLKVGSVDDPQEQQADAMADKVVNSSSANFIQRKCAHCEEEEKVQRKASVQSNGSNAKSTSDSISNSIDASRGNGTGMDSSTKSFMESRFQTDFSGVRIHNDNEAAGLSQSLRAKAFTVGNDIYFNKNEYQPSSTDGQHLLAHELTHTMQQGSGIRRSPQDSKNVPKDILGRPLGFFGGPEQEAYDAESARIGFDRKFALMAAEIWLNPITQRQKDKTKDRVRRIIDIAKTKPVGNEKGQRYYYLEKLKLAITFPFNGVDEGDEDYGCTPEQDKENRDKVDAALVKEKNDWDGLFADSEENVVRDSGVPTIRTANGKKFRVDNRDPKNIRVLIKVKLKGAAAEVAKIKKLEDAIERAVWTNTKGYILDIRFVDNTGDDVYEMNVKFCQWPNSDNWATDPVTLSHEVHHALGLPDRYDYIESHSNNPDMNVASRMEWFEEELGKTTPNNPRSKMAENSEGLLNDDVCAVAFDPGPARDKCVTDRNAFNPAGIP